MSVASYDSMSKKSHRAENAGRYIFNTKLMLFIVTTKKGSLNTPTPPPSAPRPCKKVAIWVCLLICYGNFKCLSNNYKAYLRFIS